MGPEEVMKKIADLHVTATSPGELSDAEAKRALGIAIELLGGFLINVAIIAEAHKPTQLNAEEQDL